MLGREGFVDIHVMHRSAREEHQGDWSRARIEPQHGRQVFARREGARSEEASGQIDQARSLSGVLAGSSRVSPSGLDPRDGAVRGDQAIKQLGYTAFILG